MTAEQEFLQRIVEENPDLMPTDAEEAEARDLILKMYETIRSQESTLPASFTQERYTG
jgi:hypothetical protein